MAEMAATELAKVQWSKAMEAAVKSDAWGQVVEAVDAYEALARKMQSTLDSLDPTTTDRALVNKTVLSMNLRVRALTPSEGGPSAGPTIDHMKALPAVIRGLFTDEVVEFPFDLTEFGLEGLDLHVEESKGGEFEPEGIKRGTLRPCPRLVPGVRFLSIDIEKIGLKDAETYVDPYFSITVYDDAGGQIGPVQDTPKAHMKVGQHVHFDERVFIQTPLSDLVAANAAIFFEFKHFKPRGKYISVRCWSLMEMDEIKEGPVLLEIYKKPADPKRKKIKTHSVKDLYVHVRLSLHSL